MIHLSYWTTPNGHKITIFLEEASGKRLEDFPNLKGWFEAIRARPAVAGAYARAREINTRPAVTDASRSILFGQTAAVLHR